MGTAQAAPVSSLNVGDIGVTFLFDGTGTLSPLVVFPNSNDALWAAHPELLDPDHKVLLTFGGFLIETGDQKVVVDTGFGDMEVPFPPVDGVLKGGLLLDSLKQAGVNPAEVDTVVYTHLHLDHVGWTAQAGSLTFPNARHLAGPGEWDFWRGVTDENLVVVGPDPDAVQAPLENRIESLADGQTVAPGINAMSTSGHTPGHVSLVVSSGTNRLIILGDAAPCPVQLEDPEIRLIFDVDQDLAVRTRQLIVAELEGTPDTLLADAHFTGSAFGRLLPGTGKRFVTVP